MAKCNNCCSCNDSKNTTNLGDLYHKVCMGDPLTDTELDYFVQELESLTKKLKELGPQFQLAFKELHCTLLRLKDYQSNRKNK